VPDIQELAGGEADQEAGCRRRGHPPLHLTLRRGDGPGETREGDDPGRTLEGLEAAHHLRLLSGEPLGGERFFSIRSRVVVDSLEPVREFSVARPALRARGQMRVGDSLPARDSCAPQVCEVVVTEVTARPASTPAWTKK
jgi:hypothetical protein